MFSRRSNFFKLLGSSALVIGIACATAIVAMQMLRIMHPPSASNVLIVS